MKTGSQPSSSSIPLAGLVPPGIDGTRQKAIPRHGGGAIEEQWGRSESLDPDNVGDIADEGAGHRG